MGIVDDLGKGVGNLVTNPGVLLLGALIAGLVIFRVPITQAFDNFGKSIGGLFSPTGAIQAAGAEAGQFVFNIGQDVGGAVFGAGQQAGEAVFDAGKAFGDFVGGTQAQIDQALQNFFKVAGSDITIGASNLQKDIAGTITDPIGTAISGDFGAINDFIDSLFGGKPPPEFQGPAIDPTTGFSILPLDPDRPLDLFQFAEQFEITPSEAFGVQKTFGGLDFEAIAAIPTFGEVLAENPNLSASQIANLKLIQAEGGSTFDFGTNTGMAQELALLDFGFLTQVREDPGFSILKEAEALAAMESLGGFVGGGLFANPDFPITLGESFLGKAGTVVSPSITNLNEMQLKDFIEQFG